MASGTQESYLTTEVMTATPQKLQLLLIEAAIRFIQRTRQHWQAHEGEQACEAIIRAQEIIAYILGGLSSAQDVQLTRKVAGVYLFIYRSLMEANLQQNEAKLDDAIRVLEVERETWRQVCEQLGSSDAPAATAPAMASPMPSFEPATMPSLDLSSDLGAGGSYSGFSLEA